MPDIAAGKDEAIFDLHRLPDVTLVADAGIAADITIRADLAVGADHHVAFNEDPRKNPRSRADLDHALDNRRRVNVALYQIVQTGPSELIVRLDVDEAQRLAVETQVRESLLEHVGQCTIRFEDLPRGGVRGGNKHRFIINEFQCETE